jgi:hypothetical protein
MKVRYPNFEYGIFKREKGQQIPTPDIKYPMKPVGNANKPKEIKPSILIPL